MKRYGVLSERDMHFFGNNIHEYDWQFNKARSWRIGSVA